MVTNKGEFMKQILMCLPEIFSGQKNLSKVIKWLQKRGILILILKGKRAVPVQLYIFIILLFQYFALPLLSLAILMIKNYSHLDSKRQKSSTCTTLYFYHFYVSTKVNMNKFETNELMSNWKNELEICWNKLKYVEINWNVIFSKIILILILKGKRAVPVQLYIFIILLFQYFALPLLSLAILMIKNHSHLDSKRQKSSTCTTLYFYHFYVSTKVNMNKFETNELMSNWKIELEICWNKLKYVEINWNVIFSKIILILILKGKRAVPVQLYIFIILLFQYFALPLLSLAILMIKNHSHLDSKRQKSSTHTTL